MFRDNEEPRNMLPEQVKVKMTPQLHEVPEVTLFSPAQPPIQQSRKPQTNIKPPQVAPPKSKPLMMMQAPQHSVPDLTIFEKIKQLPIQRQNFFNNNNFQEGRIRTQSKENHPNLATLPHPAVPDLTILEEKVIENKVPAISEVVFDASYKQYLKDSHAHFMKQMQEKNFATIVPVEHQTQKRCNLFQSGRKANFYENPLLKYAPKIPEQPIKPSEKVFDADTSSILIDIDVPKTNGRILEPTKAVNGKPAKLYSEEDEDELTFKRVADMLKNMQDVVLSPTKVDQQINHEKTERSEVQVLKSIAFKYLSADELQIYNVESELMLLEKKS